MTRTERSIYPKAVIRDRSESKSGMDKSFRKQGGGPHNWGSLADEADMEYQAMFDEEESNIATEEPERGGSQEDSSEKSTAEKPASATVDEDRDSALKFRLRALSKNGLDLASIARTSSAVSTQAKKSPVASPVANPVEVIV